MSRLGPEPGFGATDCTKPVTDTFILKLERVLCTLHERVFEDGGREISDEFADDCNQEIGCLESFSVDEGLSIWLFRQSVASLNDWSVELGEERWDNP